MIANKVYNKTKNIIKSATIPLLRIGNLNYWSFKYSNNYYKFYFTHQTFGRTKNIVEQERVALEDIPLKLLECSKQVDAIIDIGAHYGLYSVLLGKLNPETDLFAFEPDTYNATVANDLLRENEIKHMVFEKVVTDRTGTVEFYRDTTLGSQSHSTTKRNDFEKTIVPSISLSDFFDQKNINSAFIKIDAEGEEFKILENVYLYELDYVEGLVEVHGDKSEKSLENLINTMSEKFTQLEFIGETEPDYKHSRPMYKFLIDNR